MKSHLSCKFLIPIFFILLSLWGNSQTQQQFSVKSNTIFYAPKAITPAVASPPYLEITNINFADTDGNSQIDALEKTFIHLEIVNSGLGSGKDLEIHIDEKNGIGGLRFNKTIKINDIEVNQKQNITIDVQGLKEIKTAKALFNIVVIEKTGFHSNPILLEIPTEAFREPLVKVVDYQVSSQTSGILERRKPFDLQIIVQNIGQGAANDVSIKMQVPSNVFCLLGKAIESPGTLSPGEKVLISYTLVTSNEYIAPEINFNFLINEKFGMYSENRIITLKMNQQVSAGKLIVEGIVKPDVNIEIASFSSDIDRNIPDNEKNPNKVALIIGNENYSELLDANVNVDYARRDAEIFKQYAINTLGVEERNVYFMTDATSGRMKRELDRVVELVQRMGNQTELIFYYSGHGFPDESHSAPYLIPIDVTAANLSAAISLREMYTKFGQTNAKKITVILDACFSGGGRSEGLLTARAVRIKPKEEDVAGNMVVFAASSNDQSALPYKDKKHGMFSYFLMKKLQETRGNVTYGELFTYLKNQVGIESLRSNGKTQDPHILFSPLMTEKWEKLTF